jgi:TetR/AcrR family transcriptional regulator, repressor for uid operon
MRKIDTKRTAERRQQILDAALICFKEKGFHGATMSAICRQAKMSPGHLYHYFRGKEDLIEAIVDEDCRHAESQIGDLLESANTLDAMLVKVEGMWKKETGIHGVLNAEITAEASRSKRIAEILSRGDNRILHCLTTIFASARQRGHIHDTVDPEGFSIVLMGLINGLTASIEATGGFDLKKTTEAVRFVLFRTLAP